MTLEPLPGGLALATAGAARYLAGTGAAEGAPRARAGDVRAVADGAALNRFLAGIERRAFAMARLATGSPDDALDLVQDAMIRLAERYGDRPEAEWAPLFFRILNNRITDHHRRGAVRRRFFGWLGPRDPEDESDPLESVPGPASDGPAERVALDGAMETLEGALEALPLRQRQVFLLRTWEGLDVAETAKALGISEGSVKTHHFRAVRALRDALGEEPDDDRS
jgi:RNA polymerase sigma-70 factor (ECF subfamily)